MNIRPAKDPTARPRTRRELLSHLWGIGLTGCNIAKEGPFYAITTPRHISATHLRTIDAHTFDGWTARFRDALALDTAPRTARSIHAAERRANP